MSYWRSCFTEGYVLLENMSYVKACLTGHILWVDMSSGGQEDKSLAWYILQEDVSFWRMVGDISMLNMKAS